MGVVVGLLGGVGLMLVWFSFFPATPRPRAAWQLRLQDELIQAGVAGVSVRLFLLASALLGAFAGVVIGAVSRSPTIAVAFALITAIVPLILVRGRARTRRVALREVWPEVIDDLVSGIRAGLTLPEALAAIGERGPAPVREQFALFAEDYRVSGRFGPSLDALKARLADPVADRVIEALRLTHEVGGTDLGRLLRTLAQMIRDDLRTRGELEARQSWTVNGARLAVAAPWIVLALLSTRQESAAAFNTPTGAAVLVGGAALCAVAYRMMVGLGRLPDEERVLR